MARRTKSEAESTRQVLLDSAETLFYEKGVSRTSLEHIAKHAGMTRGAVYWHFENKNALFNALLDRVKMPLKQLIEDLEESEHSGHPLIDLERAINLAFERITQPRYMRTYTILLFRCEHTKDIDPLKNHNAMVHESYEHMVKLLTQAQRDNLIKESIDPACASRLIHVSLQGLVNDWLRDTSVFDIKVEGRHMIRLLLSMLKA
ncbi:TetR family transcriptional regulator [Larsenimonas salina]|uniref:TetR family transcriptional regulator n=1 Tax=Larsenimonas salina TaxID=1295565 RepID=UPI002073F9DB|nr:TetR family transcriptional regulator [Larsenimonas salina]MCM5703702.1 TetR family transcriptional regulator [Larsenimonas salina]